MQTKKWLKYTELIFVTGMLAFFYMADIDKVEFHQDESQWIATSNVFEAYLKLEFRSSVWEPSYWTLTQPPMARYFIGAGRLLGGFHRPDLNRAWNFERGTKFNIQKGAMPSDRLLWWSRLSMAWLAVISMALVFILLRVSVYPLAAYAWILLVTINPYFLLHLRRAMGESCLVFFTVLAVYLYTIALETAKDSKHNRRAILIWIGLAGIADGLAWASKLNAVTLIGAGIVISILLAIKLHNTWKGKITASLQYGSISILACTLTFLAVNPFLWGAPVQRTSLMFENRIMEMSQQTVDYSGSYMDLNQRLEIIPMRVFHDYTSLKVPDIFNYTLCLIGLIISSRAFYDLIKRPKSSPAYIIFLIVGFFTTSPIWLSRLDWDRYYIFPVLFSTGLIAIALGWFLHIGFRLAVRLYQRTAGQN